MSTLTGQTEIPIVTRKNFYNKKQIDNEIAVNNKYLLSFW